jgi:predicted component of type VI protein secretion system
MSAQLTLLHDLALLLEPLKVYTVEQRAKFNQYLTSLRGADLPSLRQAKSRMVLFCSASLLEEQNR